MENKTTSCLPKPPQRDLGSTFLHCHPPYSFPQLQCFFLNSKNCRKAHFLQLTFLIKLPHSIPQKHLPQSPLHVHHPITSPIQNHTLRHHGYFVFYITMLLSFPGEVQLFYGTLLSCSPTNTNTTETHMSNVFFNYN